VAKNQFMPIFGRIRSTNSRSDFNLIMSIFCNKRVTTQNLVFLSYWYRKKRLQMHF